MAKKKPFFNNNERFIIEFNRLATAFELMAISVFRWTGFPAFFRSQYIERQLYNKGMELAFRAKYEEDQTEGFMVLPVAPSGTINVLGEMYEYQAISPKRTFKRDIFDAVLIRNNELYVPTRELVTPILEEMADIRVAMGVNRGAACKTPLIIECDKNTELTALNIYKQIVGNEPVMLKDKYGAKTSSKQSYENRPPYWGRELMESYNELKKEALTIIGVLSNPVEKRERVNTVESTSNRGELVDVLDSMFDSRKLAADLINDMFGEYLQGVLGLPAVSVELNNQITAQLQDAGVIENAGGEDNGNT